jgi:hypothetical protein
MMIRSALDSAVHSGRVIVHLQGGASALPFLRTVPLTGRELSTLDDMPLGVHADQPPFSAGAK